MNRILSAIVPALAFAALLSAPPTLGAADDQPKVERAHAADDTCLVCEHSLKGVANPKTATVGGKNCQVCSDKCAAEVTAHSDYYRGVQDGMARRDRDYIGPKGGDTRKNPPQN
jgi:transcription elongation factor Elf1